MRGEGLLCTTAAPVTHEYMMKINDKIVEEKAIVLWLDARTGGTDVCRNHNKSRLLREVRRYGLRKEVTYIPIL